MSETLATYQAAPRQSALALMAGKLSVEPAKLLSTLKSTVFKGATDDELLALVAVSNTYGLNPLLKEIYAFPAKGGGIAPIVSIDGWIRMTNDHPQFDGMELDVAFSADGKPDFATCKIFRKDRTRPTVVTEYFSECFRNTDPWRQFPARMLRHKALCQCARVAFGFSGVQDEDEARDTMRNVTPAAKMTAGPDLIIPAPPAPDLPSEPLPEALEAAPPIDDKAEKLATVKRIQAACAGYGIAPKDTLPELAERGIVPHGTKPGDIAGLALETLRAMEAAIESVCADMKEGAEQ